MINFTNKRCSTCGKRVPDTWHYSRKSAVWCDIYCFRKPIADLVKAGKITFVQEMDILPAKK